MRDWHCLAVACRDGGEEEQEGREEGRIVEAIQAILRVGQRRLRTSPPLEVVNHLEAITELNRLEALLEQAVEMENWNELLRQGS